MRGLAVMGALLVLSAGAGAQGQDLGDGNIQIHGFATQAFVASNNNNYLGMDTRSGSTGWTEAAVNLNDQVSDKLRAGIQLHYTRLGAFGGDDVDVDWALGDYRWKPWLGMRAGKVKIRWGLYNDTQDYDPGYLWSLLPEPVYAVDWRATNLSQLGMEVYGEVALGARLGRMEYSGYYGNYNYAANDGYMESFRESGLNFTAPPGGKTPGFDVRWATPVRGLKVGGSLMLYNASGNLTNGTFYQPLAYWPAYYGEYERGKFFGSGQYTKLVQYNTWTVAGAGTSVSPSDTRAWFAMGGYHVTEKLEAGAYYTHDVDVTGGQGSNPASYLRDWVASGRYDIDANFYAKLEGHYIDGNGVGFYGFDNPNGMKPRTAVVVAKVGFTF